MENLKKRYDAAHEALNHLDESMRKLRHKDFQENYEGIRDSAIQRFDVTLNAFLDFLDTYLDEKFQVKIQGPNAAAVLRACLEKKIITDEEFAKLSDAVEDHGGVSDGQQAESISKNIFTHYNVMRKIFDRIKISS